MHQPISELSEVRSFLVPTSVVQVRIVVVSRNSVVQVRIVASKLEVLAT